MTDPNRVTQLLRELSAGQSTAMDDLVPVAYDELKRIADLRLRDERANHTLGATALVHEAYMKLVDLREIDVRHSGFSPRTERSSGGWNPTSCPSDGPRTLPFGAKPWELSISPDGRTVVAAVEEPRTDAWVIEDFDPRRR